MKKLLIAGAILLSVSSFTSCKKCQTCTTTTTQSYNGGTPQQTSTSEDYCGKNYDDAPAEGTVNQSAGGMEQSVVTVCVEK